MPDKVTNYQCPACTGPLQFGNISGKLECSYCGSSFELEEIEALYSEKNTKAAEADRAEQEEAQKPEEDYAPQEWGDDLEQLNAYQCPSCGAELLCDATTAATSCPYCGNNTILPGRLSGNHKPDLVIPFRYDRNAAIEGLKRHYQGKILLPKAFSDENHITEIKGVYVPFWLFDADVQSQMSFAATRSHTHTTASEVITETDHYNVQRAGSLKLRRVPVDGSSKMPDAHMDAIEPFDYKELKPFSISYLPGYLAEKYDVSQQESEERAHKRCAASAEDALHSTVTGYSTCTVTHRDTSVRIRGAKYALLPVWMLSTQWNGKNYLFAMNGQTGRMIGDLPIDKAKLAMICGGVFAVTTAIVTIVSML